MAWFSHRTMVSVRQDCVIERCHQRIELVECVCGGGGHIGNI
jgi:hypothetical protein